MMTRSNQILFPAVLTVLFSLLFLPVASADWRKVVGPRTLQNLRQVKSFPATFYVATDGNDDWSGKSAAPSADGIDGPFRTFQKAKDAVREYRQNANFDGKPIVVEVAAGVYELDQTLSFDKTDSGSADSPVIWRGASTTDSDNPKEKTDSDVILSGGRFLNHPTPVADPAVLERFKPEVREKIVQFDLSALGISDFGTPDGHNNAELFFKNRPMMIARYPNEGFVTIPKLVTEGTTETDIRGTKGILEAKFYFDDEEFTKWEKETDIWTLGYWFWDWCNSRQKVAKIDSSAKTIELLPPYHGYGYRIGQYYYLYNILCELDAPGEFFIDRDKGILYFYPPEEVTDNSLLLSLLPENVKAVDVSHFVFCGFLLEGCRGTAVTLSGQENLLCDCAIRNVGGAGINVTGPGNLIFGNHLYYIGAAGISASAGDRTALAPGRTAVVNNDIHDYGRIVRVYAAGVNLGGCGNIVAHNRITDAPHCAILWGGNDQIIEMNEIANVCFESNDAGAIYSGRDWTQRGNLIKNNYLHDITGFQNKGCVGVYLDDMFSSVDIVGNLFVNVTRAAFIGGGRDNSIVNNIFVDCDPAIHVDARALGWCADHADGWLTEQKTKKTLSGINYLSSPYAERYPKLATITEGTPKAPEGNLIAQNVVIQNAWNRRQPDVFLGDDIDKDARPYMTIENNVIGDYRLLMSLNHYPSSALPNPKIHFERIPTERIGRFDHPAAAVRP